MGEENNALGWGKKGGKCFNKMREESGIDRCS